MRSRATPEVPLGWFRARLCPHSRHAPVCGGPAAGDPASRGARLRCADRRTAVPARGCGDRRASRGRAARGCRAGVGGAPHGGGPDGVPRLLHHSGRGAGDRQRPAAQGPRGRAGRRLAGPAARRGPGDRRLPGRRTTRRPDGRQRRGAGLRRGLPALVDARTRRDAAHLRRHRRAAGPAGHTHPAPCGGRRLHAERRAESLPGLRAAVVRRRLGDRHQHRPMGHGPGLRGDGPAKRPQPRGVPAARLARRPVP